MTADKLYELLDDNGIAFVVDEIRDGARVICVEVDEEESDD